MRSLQIPDVETKSGELLAGATVFLLSFVGQPWDIAIDRVLQPTSALF
jgi:hypothetical protein